MVAQFKGLGIHFLYPDNWTLDQSQATRDQRTVTVQGPGGGFWSVALHPASVEPQELLDTALKAMRQVYDSLDCEAQTEQLEGHELVGCEMNFYCLDLTSTAWFRTLRRPNATILIHCQAEDRELEQLAPVFAAMTRSLLAGLRDAPSD